jgi:hypothetical protein
VGSATDAEGVNKYLCETVSGISFAVAFFCILAGSSWGQFSRSVGSAALGGLLAFAVTTVIHGRRIRHGGAGGAASVLASIALGWVLTVIIGFMAFIVLLNVLWFVVLPFSGHVTG